MSASEQKTLEALADVIVAYAGDSSLPGPLRTTRLDEVAAALEAYAAEVRAAVVAEEPEGEVLSTGCLMLMASSGLARTPSMRLAVISRSTQVGVSSVRSGCR